MVHFVVGVSIGSAQIRVVEECFHVLPERWSVSVVCWRFLVLHVLLVLVPIVHVRLAFSVLHTYFDNCCMCVAVAEEALLVLGCTQGQEVVARYMLLLVLVDDIVAWVVALARTLSLGRTLPFAAGLLVVVGLRGAVLRVIASVQ